MWYMIYATDKPGTLATRLNVRPEHLARLEALKSQGRLFSAGPLPAIDAENPGDAGFTGSLVIAEFASLTEAEAFANSDPYLREGVYDTVVVKPYKKVLP